MNPDEVRVLISAGEPEKIERKREVKLDSRRSKGEFILDMLALVNSHGYEPAFLLIGVEDDGTLYDISHLNYDDAKFQQIVGSLVEPKIDFQYIPIEIDGVNIGIIKIEPSMRRFHVLSKDFSDDTGGKYLEKGDLRIRAGSTKARPTAWDYERFRQSILLTPQPEGKLELSFFDNNTSYEIKASFHTRQVTDGRGGSSLPLFGIASNVPRPSIQRAEYETRLVRNECQLEIRISNTGLAPADNPLVEITFPEGVRLHCDPSKIAAPWTKEVAAIGALLRVTAPRILHNDSLVFAWPLLLFPEDGKQYDLHWKASAANIKNAQTGVLTVHYLSPEGT